MLALTVGRGGRAVAADPPLRGPLCSVIGPMTRIVASVRRARSLLLASALLAFAAASGCTSEGAATGPSSAVGESAPTTSAPPASPSTAADPPATPPRSGGGEPTDPANQGSPPVVLPTDVPVDPIERVLTGTVRRTGSCTVLLVGTRRWPLVGELADRLTAGSQVTVSGGLYPVSGTCSATESGPALRVTSVQPA